MILLKTETSQLSPWMDSLGWHFVRFFGTRSSLFVFHQAGYLVHDLLATQAMCKSECRFLQQMKCFILFSDPGTRRLIVAKSDIRKLTTEGLLDVNVCVLDEDEEIWLRGKIHHHNSSQFIGYFTTNWGQRSTLPLM
jgi:hypothetical protein